MKNGVRSLPSGVWEKLFPFALQLVDEIHKHGRQDPFWTFGGGIVLMLRYRHRYSKDIDIFVPDPQSLSYVTPRLSDSVDLSKWKLQLKLWLKSFCIGVIKPPPEIFLT